MGQVKLNTNWVNRETMFKLGSAHPPWEMHPDWVQAMKSLDSYNLWICEVVMPIVFQWVEEHKSQVYEDIPKEQWDDVGIVIAKAFGIISKLPYYQQGIQTASVYESQVKAGDFDTSRVNMTWQQMSAALDEAKKSAKAHAEFAVLGATIKDG